MSSLDVTEELSAKNATHPRVSLQSMKDKIRATYYATGASVVPQDAPVDSSLALLTICILVMHNGFTIIGKSAPASPENFDADKGRTFAYEAAIRQLWPLEGYALRETLAVIRDGDI